MLLRPELVLSRLALHDVALIGVPCEVKAWRGVALETCKPEDVMP